jgi:hypothetical protein
MDGQLTIGLFMPILSVLAPNSIMFLYYYIVAEFILLAKKFRRHLKSQSRYLYIESPAEAHFCLPSALKWRYFRLGRKKQIDRQYEISCIIFGYYPVITSSFTNQQILPCNLA